MNNKKLLSIIGLVVVAGSAGVFIYRDMVKAPIEGDSAINVTDSTSSTPDAPYTIAVEKIPSVSKAPELVRPTEFKNTLSFEAKTIILARLGDTIKVLEADAMNVEAWTVLGTYRKNLGDYEGAREAWDYAKKLAPKEVVPYNNLGDLYHYYLKDFKKSEENWKKAIEVKPDYLPAYGGLLDLYKYSMTDKKGEIPTVLKDGIAKNPDATDLMVMLAHYYQDAGDTTAAKKAYNDAIAVATRLGNTNLVTSLKGELEAVK